MRYHKGTRRKAIEYEKALVHYWKEHDTFQKSIERRPVADSYVFYDGPPFITGVPHHGTLLTSIVKDAVPRYQTMKGKRVERLWGWDCHGLPAEVFTEKKLGIQDRRDIGTKVSLEEYIVTCRQNMVQTGSLWEDTIDRIGRWVDFRGAYKTMDKPFMESVWWAFKKLYEADKIYEGEKVLLYCTRDATPLSKAEVTMDSGNYKDVTDPSVYVKFKLEDDAPAKNIKLTKQSKVLFVCFGNVSRSQIGKALYNHYTKTDNADSAGLGVQEEHPNAMTYGDVEKEITALKGVEYKGRARVALLESPGIDIVDSPRKQLVPELLSNYDLVVNIAERDQTPDWFRGDNVIWWDIADPHHKQGMDVMYETRDAVERRVKELVDGKLADDQIDAPYLLAWTTTPWTLPANTAVAVNEEFTYAVVKLADGQRLILAEKLVPKVLTDEKHQPLPYTLERTVKGSELVGRSYQPLFEDRGKNAHKVWAADYVTLDEGTGIVHLAPAYGEEDFVLAKKLGFPIVSNLDDSGYYTSGEWEGKQVWEVNKEIAKELHARGVVWKIDYIQHSYPHCYRCGTRLMYRAHPSWFMSIEGQRQEMLEQNGTINWFPEHLKEGRFAKNIEAAPDWNISRDRFWATAMPVWKGKDTAGKEHVKVVGSYAELKELSGVELEDYHRPWIDDVEFDLDGVHYKRIDKVLDCWFESGSMPFAQFHYPFENVEKFERSFPGDFIVEYMAQTRAWFYYLHAVNVGLFDRAPFKQVIAHGTLAGNDGRKMSKSYGNFTDPSELMDKYSADALRFLFLSSPLMSGEDFSLIDKDVADVSRKLSMIWNMFDFFTLYADVDKWEWNGKLDDPLPDLTNQLDIWIVSRLHQLMGEIERNMDAYNLPEALKPVLPFIDDASNWYVRRSRRRFWKSGDDADKQAAYRTLHYVLVRLSMVLAPFVPFLAEELYKQLTGGESVHLLDWPTAGRVDELTLERMHYVREVINEGLSQRAAAGLKVRQPLASLHVTGAPQVFDQLDPAYLDILKDELNVKDVSLVVDGAAVVKLDTALTPALVAEGLVREAIRNIQIARKDAGLDVDDHIVLSLSTTDEALRTALTEHHELIEAETLAKALQFDRTLNYTTDCVVNDAPLTISLKKDA